ncbi:MAG: glycerophosphodiester phosphodiesterase family protein [Actinomycetota bacterium]|nr:glycerophosphodiester phosphodiesterase family protein [Actinomycetota bacterium]
MGWDSRSRNRPLIIAHRGSHEFEPEHSLAAYLRAASEGADGIECDVRLTTDGTLVCVHDRRIDRTSNGGGTVSAMRLHDLLKYDFSEPELDLAAVTPALDERRTVLTLRVLLAAMLDSSSTMSFSIETKHPTRFGSYVEIELLEELRYFGLVRPALADSRVRVMSFSSAAIKRVAALEPTVPTVYLMRRIPPWRQAGTLPGAAQIAGISVQALLARPEFVSAVQALDRQVHVWTVNDPEQVRSCLELGVDAIISDRPGMVREQLQLHP